MLSTEYDFSSEIGPEYTGSEAWINGLEGKYYEALRDNVPDLMIWHDAYDIVYILESSAGQESMQAFAENIRLDYNLDHAVCYNGAISHADFSLIGNRFETECALDWTDSKIYMIYETNGIVCATLNFGIATEDNSFSINFGDLLYDSKVVLVNGYTAEYFNIIDEDYDYLIWINESSAVNYSLQMNSDQDYMIQFAELIRFVP